MLLVRIDRYLRHRHVTASRFGRLAANDPRLVFDLRMGRELRATTVRRVDRFLSDAGL
jgi:hypothetical protein